MNIQDREAYENWFRAEYRQEPMPRTSPAHDFCYAGWKARGASAQTREAELVAHVERLREAIKNSIWQMVLGPNALREIMEPALDATPAQSLARLRNGVLEKCESMICTELFDSTLRRNLIEKLHAMKEPI